jgi:hypothetical protein
MENGIRMIHLKDVEINAQRKKLNEISLTEAVADKSYSAKDIEQSKAPDLKQMFYRLSGVRMVKGKPYIMHSNSLTQAPPPCYFHRWSQDKNQSW